MSVVGRVYAGNGVLHPFRHIGGVVTDPLQVFGYHHQLQTLLTVGRVGGNQSNELLFDLLEQGIYDRETFVSRRQRLEEQLDDLRQSEQATQEELTAAEQNQRRMAEMIPKIQEVIDGYGLLQSVVEKNLMLKSILTHIDYDKTERNVPPRLHLTLRFDG